MADNKAGGIVVQALLCLLLFSCQANKEPEEVIPRAPVSLKIDLNHEGRQLLEPLAILSITKPRLFGEMVGHAGILVVHNVASPDQKYSAYDLICPYEYPQKVSIQVSRGASLLTAECPQCHTIYDISMGIGQPIQGKSPIPLLQYRVEIQGDMLYIYN